MLKLYDYYRSSACFRVRIALNLKGLDYQAVPVHLINHGGEQFSDAYQKINPQQLVPSLQDGDKVLTQSLAIIEYLDETHPSPPLLPADPYQKSLVRSFALAIAADLHPLNNLRVWKYLMSHLKLPEEQKNSWYHHWMKIGLDALEKKLLSHHQNMSYCFGDQPTLADICLVPQLFNARRFAFDLGAYPTLVRIDANCQKHPAFVKAWPEEASADVKG
ncbi:Maleylpyruvate isomerase [Aquicella lusitana]|uniref:Maleylacetoacetate isomerase n=1 Tax=Aquicella lusitana TaxID=254246 RepID=A0A370GJ28_9COXI|nr:maleylacetoacetate isomerase [Aquicella lusitana]VVC74457.1 Maleylpyruvate isomerase [Aquicella lusitana]